MLRAKKTRKFEETRAREAAEEPPAKKRKGLELSLVSADKYAKGKKIDPKEKHYVNLTGLHELREKRIVTPIQLLPGSAEGSYCYIATVRELPRAVRASAARCLRCLPPALADQTF